ncbi:hypothetical protein ALC62_03488, partial [Cyphomyrmex costatus]
VKGGHGREKQSQSSWEYHSSSSCRLIFWWLSRLSPTLVDETPQQLRPGATQTPLFASFCSRRFPYSTAIVFDEFGPSRTSRITAFGNNAKLAEEGRRRGTEAVL